MIASFAAIYFMTYGNIQYVNNSKLQDIAANGTALTSLEYPSDYGLGGTSMIVAPNACYSFTVTANLSGKITGINSQCNLTRTNYDDATAAAIKGANNLIIKLGNRQWQFLVSKQDNNYLIAFLDVTESLRTLNNLVFSLIKIACIALIVLFALSYFFARWAVKPLMSAWVKQSQFIADASHELKTPISIITANYDALMIKKDKTIESQMKWLDYIKIGTDRMTRLTNDLLTLAKLENDGQIHKAAFNIGDSAKEVISLFENQLAGKSIQLKMQIGLDIIINSDRDKVMQVITILVDNAVKYTGENGLIRLDISKSRHDVTIKLENSCKGVSQKDLSKVFDRFYRGDPSRSKEKEGYGLGLPIAKKIIESLGGIIRASITGNGLVAFAFSMPLA